MSPEGSFVSLSLSLSLSLCIYIYIYVYTNAHTIVSFLFWVLSFLF